MFPILTLIVVMIRMQKQFEIFIKKFKKVLANRQPISSVHRTMRTLVTVITVPNLFVYKLVGIAYN